MIFEKIGPTSISGQWNYKREFLKEFLEKISFLIKSIVSKGLSQALLFPNFLLLAMIMLPRAGQPSSDCGA